MMQNALSNVDGILYLSVYLHIYSGGIVSLQNSD